MLMAAFCICIFGIVQLREQAADKMLDGIRRYRTTNEPSNLDDAIEGIQEGVSHCYSSKRSLIKSTSADSSSLF